MNKKKMLGTLAMILVLMGYAVAAVGADPALHGRWVSDDNEEGGIRFSNDHVELFIDEFPLIRGTYTTSANTITIRFTELHGDFLSMLFEEDEMPMYFPSSWLTQSQIMTVVENGLEYLGIPIEDILYYLDSMSAMLSEFFTTETETYEVSGNTLTLTIFGDTATFTRI